MRLHRRAALAATVFVVPALGVLAGTAAGCAGDDTNVPVPGGDASAQPDATKPSEGGTDGTSPVDGGSDSPTAVDAPSDTSTPNEASAPDAADAGAVVYVRVGWFAPPYAPDGGGANTTSSTYDACIAPHGTQTWQGPLLAGAGGALNPYQVSSYFPVPAGQYDVRLVMTPAGGTATCAALDDAAAPATDFTNLPALAVGEALTVAVTPSYDGANPLNLAVAPLLDDRTTAAGMVGVRLADLLDPRFDSVDYGLGGGVVYTPWFKDVDGTQQIASQLRRPAYGLGDAGIGDGGIDSYGYVQVPPFTNIDTTLMDGTNDEAETPALTTTAGELLSAFAVPVQAGAALPPLSPGLVVCFDGQASASSAFLTECTAVTANGGVNPPTQTRFANFIADRTLPAIDTCIKYHSQTSYPSSPIGGKGQDGGILSVPFGAVTYRYDIHGGFDYDLRVVAGGGDCSTPLTPDQTFSPAAGLGLATVAYAGYVSPPADAGPAQPLHTYVFGDLGCGASDTSVLARVVNVDAVDTSPATVSFSATGVTPWTIGSVPFGAFTSSSASLDACGYLPVAAANGALTIDTSSFNQIIAAPPLTFYVLSLDGTPSATVCPDDTGYAFGTQECYSLGD